MITHVEFIVIFISPLGHLSVKEGSARTAFGESPYTFLPIKIHKLKTTPVPRPVNPPLNISSKYFQLKFFLT